eukprot:Clim_evm119s134 gene=Clim_evmTU119s134
MATAAVLSEHAGKERAAKAAQKFHDLLDLEFAEEVAQTQEIHEILSNSELKARGIVLYPLALAGTRTVMGGKIELSIDYAGGDTAAITARRQSAKASAATNQSKGSRSAGRSKGVRATKNRKGAGSSVATKKSAAGGGGGSVLYPPHKFRPGDIVSLGPYSKAVNRAMQAAADGSGPGVDDLFEVQAVVTKVRDDRICVVLNSGGKGEDDGSKDLQALDTLGNLDALRMCQAANDATQKRLVRAVDMVCGLASESSGHLRANPSARSTKGEAQALPPSESKPSRLAQSAWSSPSAPIFAALFSSADKTTEARKSLELQLIDPAQCSSSGPEDGDPELLWNNPGLDHSQKAAVIHCLRSRLIAMIHGPPGTGKTMTLVEVIHQLLQRRKDGHGNILPAHPDREPTGAVDGQQTWPLRILVCGPSNVSADNVAERLLKRNIVSRDRLVRVGHPARMLPSLIDACLDAQAERSDSASLARDARKELDRLAKELGKKGAMTREDRAAARTEIKNLRRDFRTLDRQASLEVLERASVVVATCVGTHSGQLWRLRDALSMKQGAIDGGYFDYAIIDEASQAIEAAAWLPMLMAKRVILAGDHLQLPPTVLSTKAEDKGLARTVFDRLVARKALSDTVMRMLQVQYRMHKNIAEWSSKKLYHSKLFAHDSVAAHLLCGLPSVETIEETETAVWFIDTAGCELREIDGASGGDHRSNGPSKRAKVLFGEDASRSNPGEAELCIKHLTTLLKVGLDPSEVAIITPYNAQVALLRSMVADAVPNIEPGTIEIGSVDGFQGREKEAVILSFVRSNNDREVGFLADIRRINVAVTRARRHLCVICDSETMSSNSDLDSLVQHLFDVGEVRSADQYE